MSKQSAAPQSVRQSSRQSGRQIIAALVLAVALTSLPALATHLPGPLSNVFAQPAYACPLGGSCGQPVAETAPEYRSWGVPEQSGMPHNIP